MFMLFILFLFCNVGVIDVDCEHRYCVMNIMLHVAFSFASVYSNMFRIVMDVVVVSKNQ